MSKNSFLGREHYQEYHEQEHEQSFEPKAEQIDFGDCPYCEHDDVCEGGCRAGGDTRYKFKLREEYK